MSAPRKIPQGPNAKKNEGIRIRECDIDALNIDAIFTGMKNALEELKEYKLIRNNTKNTVH